MPDISLKTLLEKGVHFGHKSSRWHPKAASYIYGERDGIHIIDLAASKKGLIAACEFVKTLGSSGKTLIFIGTKRQARNVVTEIAKREGIFYLTRHWVGGFITNWEEVKKNILKIRQMRQDRDSGAWKVYPKHEIVQLTKELRKLELVYGGVVDLDNVPDAIYVIDLKREINAVREAKRRGVAIVAIVDTNTDPTLVDYPVPGNDDAVGSIECLTSYLAASFVEGRNIFDKAAGRIVTEVQNDKDTKAQTEKKVAGRPKKKTV